MERIEPKLAPSVVLIVDDDPSRAAAVGDAIRRAFQNASVRVRDWDDLAAAPRDALIDLAIVAPSAANSADEYRSIPHLLHELKHVPTIVLASPSDPQSAVNAVLEGATDAIVMQDRFLEALPARVSSTLARARFKAGAGRRRADKTSALQRTRDENRRLRSRLTTLRQAAMLDPLTGLSNRRALESRLADLWDAAVVANTDLSCLVIDVDHFKRVNDTLGHPAGDLVLTLLSRVLIEQCRQDDIAARFGGDEFVAILSGASAPQAEAVARRVQAAFRRALVETLDRARTVSNQTSQSDSVKLTTAGASSRDSSTREPRADLPTLSIGVASRNGNRPSAPVELIGHADEALYTSKHQGRDRVCVATGVGTPATRLAAAG